MVKAVEVVNILSADGEIEKAVEKPLAFDEEIVKEYLVGKNARARVRLNVPAEFVGETRINPQLVSEFDLAPHPWTESHTVDVFPVRRLALKSAAGKSHHIVVEFLTHAQIRAGVERDFRKCGGGAKRRREHHNRSFHFTGRSFSCPFI